MARKNSVESLVVSRDGFLTLVKLRSVLNSGGQGKGGADQVICWPLLSPHHRALARRPRGASNISRSIRSDSSTGQTHRMTFFRQLLTAQTKADDHFVSSMNGVNQSPICHSLKHTRPVTSPRSTHSASRLYVSSTRLAAILSPNW